MLIEELANPFLVDLEVDIFLIALPYRRTQLLEATEIVLIRVDRALIPRLVRPLSGREGNRQRSGKVSKTLIELLAAFLIAQLSLECFFVEFISYFFEEIPQFVMTLG